VAAEIEIVVAREVDVFAITDEGRVAGHALVEPEVGKVDPEVRGRRLLKVQLLVPRQLIEAKVG
jgi:hypothetical protein